jgi:hypothetical protein
MPDDTERRRHVVQHLRHVLAEPTQHPTALRARADRCVLHDDTRQMIWQRPPCGFLDDRLGLGQRILGAVLMALAFTGLEFLKCKRQLRNLGVQSLRRLPELHPP